MAPLQKSLPTPMGMLLISVFDIFECKLYVSVTNDCKRRKLTENEKSSLVQENQLWRCQKTNKKYIKNEAKKESFCDKGAIKKPFSTNKMIFIKGEIHN